MRIQLKAATAALFTSALLSTSAFAGPAWGGHGSHPGMGNGAIHTSQGGIGRPMFPGRPMMGGGNWGRPSMAGTR